MASVSYHISFRGRAQGPISSGAIHKHVRDYQVDVARELAEEAEGEWLFKLDMRLRHQRPYYTTQIATKKIAFNRYQIHDNGVIYGHWLEGTGSRNSPVTRFPGYWSMRDTKLTMKAKRKGIAEEVLEQHQARGRLI
jgi:hypothetical protein